MVTGTIVNGMVVCVLIVPRAMVSGGETVMGSQLQRSLAIRASGKMMVTGAMVTAALILTGAFVTGGIVMVTGLMGIGAMMDIGAVLNAAMMTVTGVGCHQGQLPMVDFRRRRRFAV